MSNYTQVNDYSAKDGLATGDANKVIKGADVDAEFSAISVAIATKADTTGATFTGNVTGLDWIATNAAGPTLLNVAASATIPTVIADKADPNTGAGSAGADLYSIIAGGIEIARLGLTTFALATNAHGEWKGAILPINSISGLNLSLDTDTDHDILVAVGEAMDATNVNGMQLLTAMTKQIDNNWVAGDDLGGFPSGLTLGNATWYHVFLIKDVTNSLVDVGFDTSLTAANLLTDASDYTLYRRIGSVKTDGTANILGFVQTGDRFDWHAPVQDVANTGDQTAEQTVALSVPSGVIVHAYGNVSILTSSGAIWLYHMDVTSATPLINGVPGTTLTGDASDGGLWDVITNASRQIHYRTNAAAIDVYIRTTGYDDFRGKS